MTLCGNDFLTNVQFFFPLNVGEEVLKYYSSSSINPRCSPHLTSVLIANNVPFKLQKGLSTVKFRRNGQ